MLTMVIKAITRVLYMSEQRIQHERCWHLHYRPQKCDFKLHVL